MNPNCEKCDGTGELECECCHQPKRCADCDGDGFTECCISEFHIPENWKCHDALETLKRDAQKCMSDHSRLISVNPKSRASYDDQLAQMLKKLNAEASDLEPQPLPTEKHEHNRNHV